MAEKERWGVFYTWGQRVTFIGDVLLIAATLGTGIGVTVGAVRLIVWMTP